MTSIYCMHLLTHWFFLAHYPVQEDNIGVPELCHDGSLLEELHFILLCSVLVECLQGSLYLTAFSAPCAFFYTSKLTRPKMAYDSVKIKHIDRKLEISF